MEIVKYPHPALRRSSRPVRQVDDEVRRIAREMLAVMYEEKGVGLAANQVAIPIQLFVMNTQPNSEEAKDLVFINPQILDRKGLVEDEEGCLSFPGLYAKVKRAERVRVVATDLEGAQFEIEADGMTARVIQHEFDHLKGVLFIDKMNPLDKLHIVKQVKEFERRYRMAQKNGEIRSNQEIERELTELVAAYS